MSKPKPLPFDESYSILSLKPRLMVAKLKSQNGGKKLKWLDYAVFFVSKNSSWLVACMQYFLTTPLPHPQATTTLKILS